MEFFIAFVIIILVSECYSHPAATHNGKHAKKRDSPIQNTDDPTKISPFLESIVTSNTEPPRSSTVTLDLTTKTFHPTTRTETITETPEEVIVGPQTVVFNGTYTEVFPATTEIETRNTTITKVLTEGGETATIDIGTIAGSIPDITTIPLPEPTPTPSPKPTPTPTPTPTPSPIPAQTNGAASRAKSVFGAISPYFTDVVNQIQESVKGVPSAGQVFKAGQNVVRGMTRNKFANAALNTLLLSDVAKSVHPNPQIHGSPASHQTLPQQAHVHVPPAQRTQVVSAHQTLVPPSHQARSAPHGKSTSPRIY